MEHRPYYEAYDDRYRQVHKKKLRWFSENASPIVEEVISRYGIRKQDLLLELGCGEGRDAAYLLNRGYQLLATDISEEAIAFCRENNPLFGRNFQILDCVAGQYEGTFDFIYAISVVHMLVLDCDRMAFYRFIREHLTNTGIALIASMGDGVSSRESDVTTAFTLQERIHEQSGAAVSIAGTSYRAVTMEHFRNELQNAGLLILEEGITLIEPDYQKVMYAVVKRA